MTISEFGLRNKYTIYALSIAAIFFGVISYFTIPIQLFPETAPPLVNVLTAYPGASAENASDLVSDPIEKECSSLEGVVNVSSTSQDGMSVVKVEFRYDVEVDIAALDVQNAISRIRDKLPQNILEPQVLKFSTSDRPVLTVGIQGDDLVDVRRIAEEVLAPELQRTKGIAAVDVFGGSKPEVSVLVNRNQLDAYDIPIAVVATAIKEHNVSIPAGKIDSRERQFIFRLHEESRTIKELSQIPIILPGGNRILLENIAEVKYGGAEDQSRFHVNGESAIAVQIFRQDDANTVDVVLRARDKIAELSERYPYMTFSEAEESATFTQLVVDNMIGSVGQALLLAAVIIFLFLGSFRQGLIVAISMPMSFLLTFAGMKLLDIDLNLVTLTAIILAVGMVVDASVVVLENITRHLNEDALSPEEAARVGSSEIQFAIIAGNATTLAVLVPLLFLYGFIGKTFGPLAGTLILAFLSSLIVALVIVPILTTMMSTKTSKLENFSKKITAPWNSLMDKVKNGYLTLLNLSLSKRWVVYVSAVVLLIVGLALIRIQGSELLPIMDSGNGFVTVETTSGSSLDQTESVLKEVERIILEDPDIVRLSTQIGFEPGMHSLGGGGVQGPTKGFITYTLTPRNERDRSIWEIQDSFRDKFSKVYGIENLVVRESGSTAKSTTASSIVISIRGEDPMVLNRLGDMTLDAIKPIESVTNPYRSWRRDQTTHLLSLDSDRALAVGFTAASVARELSYSLDGMSAGTLRNPLGDDTPIRVRYGKQFRSSEKDIFTVRAVSQVDGQAFPLGAIIDKKEELVQGLVTRENLQPTLDILALHQGRPLNFVVADVLQALDGLTIPEGYTVELLGEDKDMAESRGELMFALLIAFVGVYLLLVAQFKSFVHPITVLMSIPLSLIGVGIALWLGDKSISMPVLLGFILLIGILVNNSIILIDVINQQRAGGKAKREAIVESVNMRFRPIMMTSLSTIVGMIPLALEWALGAERFSPLAIAVIGGMTASTLLTMIVIPVLYDSFDDVSIKLSELRTQRLG
ncbi:efflux RND transporter permease subunit [bacterium AH-315-J21]|nr:efflux RND transporter permease subunit [bacterium AH-315-J21]